jgi:transcriptional antiterminator RfaH
MNDAFDDGNVHCWYAIHTKPCQEERVVDNLMTWSIETVAPWLERRRAFGSRQPLFPSYVFARFDAARMLHKICFTRGVSYVVSFGGVPATVPEKIIEALRTRMNEQGVVRLTPSFSPGDTVVIQSGPMQNFVGVFEEKLSGSERVRILLTNVAFSARLEVEISDVSPACSAKKLPN